MTNPESPTADAAPAPESTDVAQTPNPVDSIPAAEDMGFGEFSFDQALENALNGGDGTPAPEGDSTPAPEGDSTPAPEGDSTPAPEGDSTPAPDLLESLEGDVPEDWTPKAASAFQRLKGELKGHVEERDGLIQRATVAEARIKELEGVVGDDTVDSLKQRIATFDQERMLTDLESTDAYKSAVLDPLDEIFTGVSSLAERYEVDPEALAEALSIEDEATQEERVSELLPEASDRDKAIFYRLAAEVEPILARRDSLHENADKALQEAKLVTEQREKIAAAERATNRGNATRNVVGRISEKLPFLSGFSDLDLDAVQESAASVDPSVVHPVDFAYQAVAAQLLPRIVQELMVSQKENDALTGQLAEYADAEPNLSGTPSNTTPAASSPKGSFAEALERQIGLV
jgi:hypothetical protein